MSSSTGSDDSRPEEEMIEGLELAADAESMKFKVVSISAGTSMKAEALERELNRVAKQLQRDECDISMVSCGSFSEYYGETFINIPYVIIAYWGKDDA